MSGENDRNMGAVASIRHALALWEKSQRLARQAREALEVGAALAGGLGAQELRSLYEEAKAAELPGRGALGDVTRRAEAQTLNCVPVGERRRKWRGDGSSWPQYGAYVYVLYDIDGAVLYIGKSCKLRQRICQGHGDKPWASIDMIRCVDEREALRLEGDLIYQHQPPLNKADIRSRRYVA